jgi:hypothetical protein
VELVVAGGLARPSQAWGTVDWLGAVWAVVDLLDVLVREAAQVERLVRDADLAAPVAACPGWTVYELVTNLGAIHRWAAAATRTPRRRLG